ncbi:MAG: hypothetical protein R3291_02745 [Thermoplasmata archaeon]|nr:hypothetical protein [Thermoplasmata archaeon]
MESRYHPGRAVVSGLANAVPFLIVPIFVLRTLPGLLGQFLPPEVVAQLLMLESVILPLGIGVTVLAALTALFGKGLAGRAAFGTGRQAVKLAWVYFVFAGGLISLSLLNISFFLDFHLLLYFLYAAILIGALYFVLEYFVYRRAYREAAYPPEYYPGGPY